MPPSNPLVKGVVVLAGVAAGMLANQLMERGWSAVFHETAPSDKAVKKSQSDAKSRRKEAKKDGATKEEIERITDLEDEQPIWKLLLWTALSGVVVQTLRMLAERGAQNAGNRLLSRRPPSNRG
ncbi:MAG: DUF4235 domain-containing protein [Brachybacterium sp.]|nr:DUF4235 domain-containing protein [Brachybacterium sp.]